jgi:hypothetical protein
VQDCIESRNTSELFLNFKYRLEYNVMKKWLSLFVSILFITLSIMGCGNTQSKEQDIRKIVWNKLPNESKKEVIGTWKDAKLEKVVVNKKFVYLNDVKYDGKELYHVVFKTKNDSLLGPIGSYIDPETKEIVGGDYRE